MYRNMWYGYSDMQRVAGQATALREITEFDIIEIVKSMFAGYGIILVDQEHIPDDEKVDDLNTIMRNLKPGTFSAMTKQGDKGVEFQQFHFQTDLNGITGLIMQMERMIIGHSQVPGAFLGREDEQNMATLYGKTRSFFHGPVRDDRNWIGDMLSVQWYENNLKHIDPDALKEIKVKVKFENLPVDAWLGIIGELVQLRQLFPSLPETEILRLAELDFLADKIGKEGMSKGVLKAVAQQTDVPELRNKLNNGNKLSGASGM